MEEGRIHVLHGNEGTQDRCRHLVDFVDGKLQITLGIITEILSFKQLHLCIKQPLQRNVAVGNLNNIGMVNLTESEELIFGVLYGGCIAVKDFDCIILVDDCILSLEHTAKGSVSQLLIKH